MVTGRGNGAASDREEKLLDRHPVDGGEVEHRVVQPLPAVVDPEPERCPGGLQVVCVRLRCVRLGRVLDGSKGLLNETRLNLMGLADEATGPLASFSGSLAYPRHLIGRHRDPIPKLASAVLS